VKLNLYRDDDGFGFLFTEADKVVLSSSSGHFLTSFVNQRYDSSLEALVDARRVAMNHSYLLKVAAQGDDASEDGAFGMESGSLGSGEEAVGNAMVDSFISVYKDLSSRIDGAKSQDTDEERGEMKDTHKVLTIVTNEIESIVESLSGEDNEGDKEVVHQLREVHDKFYKPLFAYWANQKAEINPQIMQMLSPQEEDSGGMGGMGDLGGLSSIQYAGIYRVAHGQLTEVAEEIREAVHNELLETYAEKTSRVMSQYHDNLTYRVEYGDQSYIYIDTLNGEPLLLVRVNDKLNIDNIMPLGKIASIYPFYSTEFYQKYWKPIVDSIGHFYVNGYDAILFSKDNPLPDVPGGNKKYNIQGWDTNQRKTKYVDISFKGKKPKIWLMEESDGPTKKVSPEYSEQDYLNAIVQCIDKNQKSIYGEIGQVVQVVPLVDSVELDVRFIDSIKNGRNANDVVRLTGDQVEILSDEQITNLDFVR